MLKETSETNTERFLIIFFRLAIGWTFLWAAIHHFGDDKFVTGFLSHSKTFHDLHAPFTNPTIAPTLTFLVEYGHLLIGLSLISGLLVRASANYIVDYHIVYAGVLIYLVIKRAGHVLGLDGWVDSHLLGKYPHPVVRWLVAR
jgi:thiosulfate dehydrogenase (quinone) large subunit